MKEKKCPFCNAVVGKEIKESGIGSHMRGCRKRLKVESELPTTLLYHLFNFPFLTKEYLQKELLDADRSLPEFCVLHEGLHFSLVTYLAEYYGLRRPSIKERFEDPNSKFSRKRKEACFAKYGSENPLGKGTPGYLKRNKTVQERYGVSNVFKLLDFKEKKGVGYLRKYGVTFEEFQRLKMKNWIASLTDEQKTAWLKSSILNGSQISKLESRVGEKLIATGFSIESSFFLPNKKKGQGAKSWVFDFRIKDTNVLVEVNGSYWHGDPRTYKGSDLVKGSTVESIWEKDARKSKEARELGYLVVTLWEMDVETSLKKESFASYFFEEFTKQGGRLEDYNFEIYSED